MARSTTADRLTAYEHHYRQLARQLTDIGLIASGSIIRRYTRCGTPGCRCHADPPQPHGPYWQWSTKINGKTVTRRLTEHQAHLYKEWIANDRQLRHHRQNAQDRRQSLRTTAQRSRPTLRPRFNHKRRNRRIFLRL